MVESKGQKKGGTYSRAILIVDDQPVNIQGLSVPLKEDDEDI